MQYLMARQVIAVALSNTTKSAGRFWRSIPDTTGSLGCAISEAVEKPLPRRRATATYWAAVLNQVLLHQSIIGLETKIAMDKAAANTRISSSAARAAAPTWAA